METVLGLEHERLHGVSHQQLLSPSILNGQREGTNTSPLQCHSVFGDSDLTDTVSALHTAGYIRMCCLCHCCDTKQLREDRVADGLHAQVCHGGESKAAGSWSQ